MAKFVDKFCEYRKMHGNVSKQVTLVTEMSKIVEERKLMAMDLFFYFREGVGG